MQVVITDKAQKQIDKLEKSIQERIYITLEKLSFLTNPKLVCRKMEGVYKGFYRYRVGVYRIILDIQDDKLLIKVIKVAHRKEVYKQRS